MKNIPYILLKKDKSPVSKGWKLKNEDEIDESHKSQLKFKYNVYLLNNTIKIKT